MSSPLKLLDVNAARATPARKEEAAAAAQALRAGSETPLALGAAPASANKRKRATEPDNLRAWSKDTYGAPPGPAFVTAFKVRAGAVKARFSAKRASHACAGCQTWVLNAARLHPADACAARLPAAAQDDKDAAQGGRKRACTGVCRSFWPSTCTGVVACPARAALPSPDQLPGSGCLAVATAAERSARAAAEEAANAAAVPADVAALLSRLSLSSYGAALRSKLGVTCVEDLCYVTKKMLRKHLPALLPVERAKLLEAAVRAAVKSPRPKRSASAFRPYDLMITYRVSETGEAGDSSVFALKEALEALGYRVFVGETAIQGGSSWTTTIQNGVEGCRAFVVLCSETFGNAAVSPWTKRELELADSLKKPLIPVWHSGTYPPPAVKIFLSGVHRIPSGNIADGYASAGISHEAVADQVAAALAREGVLPSSPPTQSA
jgi:hypothetical protein